MMNQQIILADISLDILSMIIGGGIGAFFIAMMLFGRIKYLKVDLESKKAEKRIIEEKFDHLQQELLKIQTEKAVYQKQVEQSQLHLKDMEERFSLQFENLANRIFEEKTSSFKKQSQEGLNDLLNPLREKIQDFQKKVDDSFGKQANEQFALKEQIKMIVQVNEKMTLQAEGLANALKGDSKVQGDWGEIILEKLLEDAGLQKGVNYITQGVGLGLKNSETGNTQKPDIVITLPENKHIILDSKVSLTDYERYHSEHDVVQKQIHLVNYLASVKKHVKDLETRRYQDTDKLGTPDFVLMFMPLESAYMLALQQDRALHQFAWDKGVAIVCPSTLFSSLKTISSLWRLADQNKNALEIAQKGGALYDKVAGFVKDMEDLGHKIKSLEGTYEGAMNKLSMGKGNILSRTQHLKFLGVSSSKTLPSYLLDSNDDGIISDQENGNELSSDDSKAA